MAVYTWECRLRWSDMDAYGHVNNVSFLRYLEDARVALLFHHPDRPAGQTFEGQLVVVRHEIDYRCPLVYRPAPVLIHTYVAQLSAASVTLEYTVVDGSQDEATTYATARTVLAAYDLERGRPRRFTSAERSWLERFRPDD